MKYLSDESKFLFLVFTYVFMISCQSSRHADSYALTYERQINSGECEEAQAQIPLEKDNNQFIRIYQGSIGYITYVSSLAVTVPLDILLLGRCKYGCLDSNNRSGFEFFFPTSSYDYEVSKESRCPDTSYYVHKFLEVAECYEKRGSKESLQKSLEQLIYLDNEFESGPTCIRRRDAEIVKVTKFRVEQKIQGTYVKGSKND